MSANDPWLALDALALLVFVGIAFMLWTLWKLLLASRRKPNAPLDPPAPPHH
jgi:threonine/homoserine/homoserine lactone efflux protein